MSDLDENLPNGSGNLPNANQLKIFAINFNFLRILSGMGGGLAYVDGPASCNNSPSSCEFDFVIYGNKDIDFCK